MQFLRKFCTSLLAALLVGVSGPSLAGSTAPAPFNVNITVAAVCSLAGPSDINVTYDPSAGSHTIVGSPFSVTCTSGTPYTFDLDSTGLAVISGATAPEVGLVYDIDVADTPGLAVVGGTATGVAQDWQVRAIFMAGQTGALAGSTSKTHTIAINY